jgi:hypothetical protein
VIEFDIKDVQKRSLDMCQRNAVLYPLAGKKPPTEESSKWITWAMHRLVKQRRARISDLRTAGWEAPARHNWTWIMNCPPFSVHTGQSMRCCRYVHFCPFCWAREVVGDAFERVQRFYYQRNANGKRERRPRSEEYHLIEHTLRAEHTRRNRGVAELIQKLQPQLPPPRHRRAQETGAIRMFTIEPGTDCWVVKRRSLVLVRSDYPSGDHKSDSRVKVTFRRHTSLNLKILAGAVGRVFRYPVKLMRADSDDVLEIIQARRHGRLYGHYGQLRGSLHPLDSWDGGCWGWK